VDNQNEILIQISKELERIATAQEKMVILQAKQQPNRVEYVLAMIGAAAGAASFVSIIDVILKWLGVIK